MTTTADWDAKTYDRLAAPQEEWARGVLKRLPLQGDETVLDAGCGSGRVTRLLLERLPRGRVIGADGSISMIANSRESLSEHSGRTTFHQQRPARAHARAAGRGGWRRERRRGLLERDISLDRRSRPALLAPVRGTQPRRAARRPVRGEGNVETWVEAVVRTDHAQAFIGVVGLASLHERLPEELREPFTEAVLDELPEPLELRYIRLNINGRRHG